VRVTSIKNAPGCPECLPAVSRDIPAQKETELQKHLLMLEMAHRVKNILSVVQAIATMSLRGGVEISSARENFNARLLTLARAQDQLLQKAAQSSATVDELLTQVLAIHGNAAQLPWHGPEVVFGSTIGLSFSLVIHELYTNALKYGALSCEDGRLTMLWHISGSESGGQFEFDWVASGAPAVNPPTRRGFGSRLIEHSLTTSLKSSVKMIYAAESLRFQLKTDPSYGLEN